MTWTTPKTFVSGDVLTAAEMNTYVRDNTSDLNTRMATFESGGWVPLGSGSGTASSVAMAEPAGERIFKVILIVNKASGTHQVSCTLNAISSGYTGQFWNVASDAIAASTSQDYGSTSAWAITPSTTLALMFMEIDIAYHNSNNQATMLGRLIDSTANTSHWISSGNNGSVSATIDTITVSWGASSPYSYAIMALDI